MLEMVLIALSIQNTSYFIRVIVVKNNHIGCIFSIVYEKQIFTNTRKLLINMVSFGKRGHQKPLLLGLITAL